MLTGKRIVVTGSRRGLGAAIARVCTAHGAIVGGGFDVRDELAVHGAIKSFCAEHGHIDGWVNNAAINLPGLLIASDLERARQQLEVNLLGPILCTRAVLPHMLKQKSGVILNISSVAAERPTRGQSVYAATKGGLESFTRAIAVEYARKGIRALCLRPGPIDTDMLAATRAIAEEELVGRIPQGRVATADEIAEHAAYLLSDRAAYMTGSVVTVDGGYLQA
jgi:3-oxoacyl-[acyl-carrier protein] reductase